MYINMDFSCAMLPEPPEQHCIRFFLWNFVPGALRQHCTGFFLCNVIWSLFDNIS